MPVTALREATLDDVEFLGETLFLGTVPPPTVGADHPAAASWIEGARRDAIAQVLGEVADSTTYVILADGEHAGRLRARHLIGGIQILLAYRRQGIGTSVITTLLREAHGNAVPLDLRVSGHNAQAERLYTRLGLVRTGEEEDGENWMRASPGA